MRPGMGQEFEGKNEVEKFYVTRDTLASQTLQ